LDAILEVAINKHRKTPGNFIGGGGGAQSPQKEENDIVAPEK
jgi:hypothetical protein